MLKNKGMTFFEMVIFIGLVSLLLYAVLPSIINFMSDAQKSIFLANAGTIIRDAKVQIMANYDMPQENDEAKLYNLSELDVNAIDDSNYDLKSSYVLVINVGTINADYKYYISFRTRHTSDKYMAIILAESNDLNSQKINNGEDWVPKPSIGDTIMINDKKYTVF